MSFTREGFYQAANPVLNDDLIVNNKKSDLLKKRQTFADFLAALSKSQTFAA